MELKLAMVSFAGEAEREGVSVDTMAVARELSAYCRAHDRWREQDEGRQAAGGY